MNNSTNASLEHYDACEGGVPFFTSKVSDNVPYFVAVVIIFTSGFIGNIVTVAVISCWVKLHTTTFTMIACLAASDAYSLLLFTLTRFTNVRSLIYCTYIKDPVYMGSYFATWNTFHALGRYNAGMQLCVLACLRFTAVVYPLKFRTYCTCKAVILIFAITSVFVLIFSVVISILMYDTFTIMAQHCTFFSIINAVNFMVPTSVFIMLHCLKLRALRRSPALKNNASLKMNIVLSLIMIIYVVSSASYIVVYVTDCFTFQRFFRILYSFANTSFLVNCAVNPFIYFFASPPIAQLFRKIWHRIHHKHEIEENGNTGYIAINTNSPS